MQIIIIGLLLIHSLNEVVGTCVLESEFGFILNCNFKKSGLFRVRNLGGLKAHFGLGFSLGDELGFGESLGNLEGNRRRALNFKTGLPDKFGVVPFKMQTSTFTPLNLNETRHASKRMGASMTEVAFLPLGVPTFRPIQKSSTNLVRRSDMKPTNGSYNQMTISNLHQNGNSKVTETNFNSFNILDTNVIQNSSEIIRSDPSRDVSKKTDASDSKQTYEDVELLKNQFGINTSIVKNYTDFLKKKSKTHLFPNTMKMVMNAPKEYYPSGYDRNFDDNFESKVALPLTDFECEQQKYFPGLYANIDLGCMVFHVCAITDKGIIMKSFLCPESTLFDQSILKCNWWFYVDCNSTIYDSNIPISKSYQLIKSISYFSNFTKMQALDKTTNQKNLI